MAWCRQATSHYPSQCWPRSLSPYGVIRPQLVNLLCNLKCLRVMRLYNYFKRIRLCGSSSFNVNAWFHYNDVRMSAMASQITSLTIVYSTVYSGTDQRKHQSSTSLAFVRGIHRRPGEFPTQMASNAENVSIWWRHHVTEFCHSMRWEKSLNRFEMAWIKLIAENFSYN